MKVTIQDNFKNFLKNILTAEVLNSELRHQALKLILGEVQQNYTYEHQGETVSFSEEEKNKVRHFFLTEGQITAIKYIRTLTNCSLILAKEICEEVCKGLQRTSPDKIKI